MILKKPGMRRSSWFNNVLAWSGTTPLQMTALTLPVVMNTAATGVHITLVLPVSAIKQCSALT